MTARGGREAATPAAVAERRLDQHAERHQKLVARGAQDGEMEAGVGLRSARGSVVALAHFAAGRADLGHLLVGAALRRQGGRLRLDDVAEFLHGAAGRLRGRATSRTSASTSRSSRFQRSRGSTQLPTLGREASRLLAISILIASRTAERLTSKVCDHFASLGRMVPGG